MISIISLMLSILAVLLCLLVMCSIDVPASDTSLLARACRKLRGSRACSFIIKFGCVLVAFGLLGAFAGAAVNMAMAFAIPKPTKVEPSSWFDHDHNVATTIPFGAVVPVDWRFLMPGERYKQNLSGFCRALSLKAPVMQDIDLKYATFFVPIRLLSDNYENIISEIGSNSSFTGDTKNNYGLASSEYDGIRSKENMFNPFFYRGAKSNAFPYFLFDSTLRDSILSDIEESSNISDLHPVSRSFVTGGLMDYLGFPVGSYSSIKSAMTDSGVPALKRFNTLDASVPLSLLPLESYHSICNHFFVDEFHRRDYHDSLVNIDTSLEGQIPITAEIQGMYEDLFALRYSSYESDYFTKSTTSTRSARISSSSSSHDDTSSSAVGGFALNADSIRGMFQLDEYARKVEMFFGDVRKQIKLMFGVKVSDKSAMSPILVDSGSAPIQVSELTNMTGGNSVTAPDSLPLGASAGKMTSGFGKSYNEFEVEEHGVLMTCVWIRPRTLYVNKVPYMFTQFLDNDSIPNPLFAQIGERGLHKYELSFKPFTPIPLGSADKPIKDDLFGYNVPYVQYKYSLDTVSGDFRDNLAYWHCGRDFDDSFTNLVSSYRFSLINPDYYKNEQSLNRIFNVITAIDGSRPFQLQLRFKTEIWQPYPHIDNEF